MISVKRLATVGTSLVLAIGALGMSIAPSYAETVNSDISVSSQQTEKIDYRMASQNRVVLSSDSYTFTVNPEGVATATSVLTGNNEELPEYATDVTGKKIELSYSVDAQGNLTVTGLDLTQGWVKCTVGIAGGAIGGATTGGLAGAAVGTVTLPIVGTVSGAVVGIVGGGIGGGMVGGATTC